MSELMPFHRPSSALTRKVQQQLTQLVAETGLSQARVQSRAEVEAARASAVAQVGQRAMTEIAMLTKLERDLTETVPAAQARLVAIGDLTQIALGSVVMNAARRIGG
jgi:predicted XRE-type DNA-binding protein